MSHPLSRDNCQLEAGQQFTVDGDLYTLGGAIGNGAAGIVRKATRGDGMRRAVKFLAPDPKYIEESAFDDVAARFVREGERGARLDHPHLVRVYTYCENTRGSCFEAGCPTNPLLVMEEIQGRTLEHYILKYPGADHEVQLTKERLHIAIQIACALEALHKRKIVHRDVKPANIFVCKRVGNGLPHVKLGDFGVTKWNDFHASVTTGTLTATYQKGLGTLKYMSPEQALEPKYVGIASDMFSLGITLFELFTGSILAGPHQVFEVMFARLSRGGATSRFASMGYALSYEDDHIASIILDMHLRGQHGRPKISNVRGRLEYEYERRFDRRWDQDLDRGY